MHPTGRGQARYPSENGTLPAVEFPVIPILFGKGASLCFRTNRHCGEPSQKTSPLTANPIRTPSWDLARKLNYSDKSVSKWERGEGLPDVYILAQIAQLYGVTVSNLIGEEEPPKKANPHFHIYVLLLSVALVFVIAAILFTAFTIAAVPFPSWLFFLYAVPVSSIVCIVFTSLWWGILMQGLSITALIWSAGACIYLSIPIPNLSLIFVVCAAVQVLITLWELFRFSRTRTWF